MVAEVSVGVAITVLITGAVVEPVVLAMFVVMNDCSDDVAIAFVVLPTSCDTTL